MHRTTERPRERAQSSTSGPHRGTAVSFATLALLTLLAWAASPAVSRAQPVGSGVLEATSDAPVAATVERLESAIRERGMTLFQRIDHGANAASVDQELPPTVLVLFGNPNVGTRLMRCNRGVGLDLPMKMLVYRDEEGVTRIAWNDPLFLRDRHAVEGCDAVFRNVAAALQGLARTAAGG